MDLSMNPGLAVWLGIRPPEWDEYDEDWDEEEFSLKANKKRKPIRIRKSDFRRVF